MESTQAVPRLRGYHGLLSPWQGLLQTLNWAPGERCCRLDSSTTRLIVSSALAQISVEHAFWKAPTGSDRNRSSHT